MSGIPVITVSDDGFGHAIKKTLEFAQRFYPERDFGLSELPAIDEDYLLQVQSGGLFLVTHSDAQDQVDQAQRGILRQLEGAGLIETVGPEEFRLTPAGRQTIVELAR